MDPSLLKEREAFKKRALAVPVIERRKTKPESSNKRKRPTIPDFVSNKASSSRSATSHGGFNYKMFQDTSKNKFKILASIVNFLKDRFKRGDTFNLNIDEILDETNMLDVSPANKAWLTNDALPNNPKISLENGTYSYKPTYNLRGRKDLLRLLDYHDQHGLGGILLDDIIDSLPHAEKRIKDLGDQVIQINRPLDKKKVLFYNDKDCQLIVDEEFRKLWRSTAVDSIDDSKIEEYLKKQGITSMQDTGIKKFAPAQKRRTGGRKRKMKQLLNEHVADQLKDYTEDNNS